MENKPSIKIKLSRESVKKLTLTALHNVKGGQRDPTASCGCSGGHGATC